MRLINHHSSAAKAAATMPFEGLGFAVDSVQAAAQEMNLTPHCHRDSSGSYLPAPALVMQPSGYELLVSLGREIRGR